MTHSTRLEDRAARLTPLVANAMNLLAFATENGRPVDDKARKALIQAADALQQHALTPEIEESFLKAYQELTMAKAMEGVTAETLEASRTRMPGLGQLLTGDWHGLRDNIRHITLGRIVHFVVFLSVLLSAGYILGQYTIGAMLLDRYQTSTRCLDNARSNAATEKNSVTPAGSSSDSRTSATSPVVTQPDASDTAPKGTASPACKPAQAYLLSQYTAEQKSVHDELERWMRLPCRHCYTRWALCMFPDDRSDDQNSSSLITAPQTLQLMAEIRQRRTGEIEVPMLLGLLGAYSYVLRRLSLDIQNRTFAPGSLIHNVVRLSLGALAGLASVWLFKPESFNLPAHEISPYMGVWALAFIAGYSIELVFTFLDKIVSAFTSKPT